MKYWHQILIISLFFDFTIAHFSIAQNSVLDRPDVMSYEVTIEPNISQKYFEGVVTIDFESAGDTVRFDCGNLKINHLEGDFVARHQQKDKQLIVHFNKQSPRKKRVVISYSGKSASGVKFFPEKKQMHTAYFTSHWMVCNIAPDDRAKINVHLIVPDKLKAVANGVLTSKESLGKDKTRFSWMQTNETPAYTYGFVVGDLNVYQNEYKNVSLEYYANHHTPEQLKQIFATTEDIISFFEEKTGTTYFQQSYIQVLGVGNTSQEITGLAILRDSYGEQVLNDPTQINLSAHELAHQWWGNMITCENWNHFWLNEAMAVFMSTAYKEHRFGKGKYNEDIQVYIGAYEKVKEKGVDKSLVFPDWNNPTPEDRTIVYYKGAYVLHLLKEELGDSLFWEGIKHYTQSNYGKSVNTRHFQTAMEQISKRDLSTFFNQWVY